MNHSSSSNITCNFLTLARDSKKRTMLKNLNFPLISGSVTVRRHEFCIAFGQFISNLHNALCILRVIHAAMSSRGPTTKHYGTFS